MMRTVSLLFLATASAATSASAQTYGPFELDSTSAISQLAMRSGPALWSDYDEDGDLDLAVGNAFGPNELFVNDGGVFSRQVLPNIPGFNAAGGAWADLDGDGRLDLLMCSLQVGGYVYWQNADGGFSPQQFYSLAGVRDCSVADVDLDGRPDVFVLHRAYEGRTSKLLLNQGDRSFVLGQEFARSDGSQSSWADVDGDGDLDLLHASSSGQPDRLLLSEGGRLVQSDLWPRISTSAQSGSWADYDNDGDFDLFATDHSGDNLLYANENGRLDVVSTEPSGQTFGSAWGDIDNDGMLDRVSVDLDGPGRIVLRAADGSEETIAIGTGTEGFAEAVTLVDHDADGDLDLLVTYGRHNSDDLNRVYTNTGAAGNWMQIALEGTADAGSLGATVQAFDQVEGAMRAQTRAVLPRSGRKAQTGATVHFGLGTTAAVDSVVVKWPSGACLMLEEVPVNQLVRITEPNNRACVVQTHQEEGAQAGTLHLYAPFPNPAAGVVRLTWTAPAGTSYQLEVVNALGQVVHRIQGLGAGEVEEIEWRSASHVSPGVYTVRLQQPGAAAQMRRFTVVR